MASTGLELPWVQGLCPVVPLGFASGGRELEAEHIVRKTGGKLGFMKRFVMEIVVCVRANTWED